jgi:hypothetical protein
MVDRPAPLRRKLILVPLQPNREQVLEDQLRRRVGHSF